MVNQQINSLPRPIKWFSVPRLCRAERPQKGRLREFFQWNIDIIGVENDLWKIFADAEVIFTTVDYLRSVGLTSDDVKVKISSRELLRAYLISLGILEERLESIYVLLDKKAKLPPDTFEEILKEHVRDNDVAEKILDFMNGRYTFDQMVKASVGDPQGALAEAASELDMLLEDLKAMGIGEYCEFDPSIVRGLAYYTGMVFEVHATSGELRAICGGGRYDNLLRDFGGPAVSATGMGMGDCVLEILLKEKGLLDNQVPKRELDYFVVAIGPGAQGEDVFRIIAELRSKGYSVNFSYKFGLAKQMKEAASQNAKWCIIMGLEELDSKNVKRKDMRTGEQEVMDYEEFLAGLKSN
jgi:histidyl-tRNA synthetase